MSCVISNIQCSVNPEIVIRSRSSKRILPVLARIGSNYSGGVASNFAVRQLPGGSPGRAAEETARPRCRRICQGVPLHYDESILTSSQHIRPCYMMKLNRWPADRSLMSRIDGTTLQRLSPSLIDRMGT